MAWQLIYTSAPRLLEAGRSGFGTVARDREIPALLVGAIERASQFARGPGLDPNRVIYSHRIVSLAGGSYHVLSCIRDAGASFTGRTNHLAHHLIAEAREVAALSAEGPSPADVLLAMPWRHVWEEAPAYFDEEDRVALADCAPQTGQDGAAWAQATGEAAHAWHLATSEARQGVCVIAPAALDLRVLFAESLRLTAPERRWQVRFTTALQPSDDAAEFRWLGLEPSSPLCAELLTTGRAVLDLTDPANLPAPEGPRVASAPTQAASVRGSKPVVHRAPVNPPAAHRSAPAADPFAETEPPAWSFPWKWFGLGAATLSIAAALFVFWPAATPMPRPEPDFVTKPPPRPPRENSEAEQNKASQAVYESIVSSAPKATPAASPPAVVATPSPPAATPAPVPRPALYFCDTPAGLAALRLPGLHPGLLLSVQANGPARKLFRFARLDASRLPTYRFDGENSQRADGFQMDAETLRAEEGAPKPPFTLAGREPQTQAELWRIMVQAPGGEPIYPAAAHGLELKGESLVVDPAAAGVGGPIMQPLSLNVPASFDGSLGSRVWPLKNNMLELKPIRAAAQARLQMLRDEEKAAREAFAAAGQDPAAKVGMGDLLKPVREHDIFDRKTKTEFEQFASQPPLQQFDSALKLIANEWGRWKHAEFAKGDEIGAAALPLRGEVKSEPAALSSTMSALQTILNKARSNEQQKAAEPLLYLRQQMKLYAERGPRAAADLAARKLVAQQRLDKAAADVKRGEAAAAPQNKLPAGTYLLLVDLPSGSKLTLVEIKVP